MISFVFDLIADFISFKLSAQPVLDVSATVETSQTDSAIDNKD